MDFVKKKAFEAQINKVGKDLGLGSNVTSGFGGGSSEGDRNAGWNIFSSGGNNDEESGRGDEGMNVSPEVIGYYESRAKNFPPLVHLFYVEFDILSEAAKRPVTLGFGLFVAIEALLLTNTLVAGLFVGLESGKDWEYVLISGIVSVLLSIYELLTYEICFRGAYQTSTHVRKQYIGLLVANLIPIGLYAFLGVGFFNGWTRISNLRQQEDDGDVKHGSVRKVFAGIEAMCWTVLIFYNLYVVFEYYQFMMSREQGLCQAAIREGNDVNESEDGGNRSRSGRTRDARTQEIWERYRPERG